VTKVKDKQTEHHRISNHPPPDPTIFVQEAQATSLSNLTIKLLTLT